MAAGIRTLIVFATVVMSLALCAPTPGGDSKHVKYVIHVPIKYHTIHHVKVEKVPIHIKKHIHHHKEPVEHHDHHHDGYDREDDHEEYGYSGESHEDYY